MASLFSSPKSPPKPAAPPPPPATPTVGPDTDSAAMMKVRRRSGFQKTILTGDLAPATTDKKQLLGG